jgi:hypothetical protein
MPFVIESRHKFKKKDGSLGEGVAYFDHRNTLTGMQFNCMVASPEDAKQYEFATEAHRDRRKYFPSQAGVKVIRYDPPETEKPIS